MLAYDGDRFNARAGCRLPCFDNSKLLSVFITEYHELPAKAGVGCYKLYIESATDFCEF